MALIKVADPLR